jgi:hypothetical protein
VRFDQRVFAEDLDQRAWSAYARPGVVPEGRYQPGSIFGKEKVGKYAGTSHVAGAPAESLRRPGSDEDIGPISIQQHLGNVLEDNAVGTGTR